MRAKTSLGNVFLLKRKFFVSLIFCSLAKFVQLMNNSKDFLFCCSFPLSISPPLLFRDKSFALFPNKEMKKKIFFFSLKFCLLHGRLHPPPPIPLLQGGMAKHSYAVIINEMVGGEIPLGMKKKMPLFQLKFCDYWTEILIRIHKNYYYLEERETFFFLLSLEFFFK